MRADVRKRVHEADRGQQTFDQPDEPRRAVAAQRELRHRRPPRSRSAHADRARNDPLAKHQRPTRRPSCSSTSTGTRGATPSRRSCASGSLRRLHARRATMRGDRRSDDDHAAAAGRHAARLTQQQRFLAPDDGNTADRTVMAVPLPPAVGRTRRSRSSVEWTAKIPRPFARTGYVGDYYFIAQWFPKLGVLEDRGWNTHQFHAATEFYSDYGVYDVRMTVPAAVRRSARPDGRCAARRTTRTARRRIATRAEDIHDFAWTASPRLHRLAADVRASRRCRAVEMRLLLQPEHAGQEVAPFRRHRRRAQYYGEWYGPIRTATSRSSIRPIQSGAAAWSTRRSSPRAPAGSRRRASRAGAVTIHEAGHQWWYGMVGSNEFEHAWMDEGLNTFSEARTMEAAAFPNYLGAAVLRRVRAVGDRRHPAVARATD